MIKEKLAVFLGSKAMYITIASVLVGATAVTGTVVGVNQHNKHKSDFVETDTVITESVTDISTETKLSLPSAEEVSAKASGAGNDLAMQYLKEYNKLTDEYKKKRAALEEQTTTIVAVTYAPTLLTVASSGRSEPTSRIKYSKESDEQYSDYINQYISEHETWEQESLSRAESNSVVISIHNDECAEVSKYNAEQQSIAQDSKSRYDDYVKQIAELDAQYERDLNALKIKYGV